MRFYIYIALIVGALLSAATLATKIYYAIYYAGAESVEIKNERINHEASQKAREIERDSARCTPPCILPDPFRKE